MQTKTLSPSEVQTKKPRIHTAPNICAVIASAAAGFLITNVKIGGTLSPFLTSLISALTPLYGTAALFGGICSALVTGSVWKCIAELSAAVLTVIYCKIFSRQKGSGIKAIAAGLIYFICASAVSAGSGDWVLFAAVFFRGLMCSAASYCMCETKRLARKGCSDNGNAKMNSVFYAGIVYMIIIAALCSKTVWIINAGRIAAGFCTAAAARKFGVRGGGAVGVLSASAFLLAEQSLGRCGAMLAFAGLASGLYHIRGKYAVNICFICSAFGITAAAGMPSGTPEFIADMGIAAALYCLIPERLYMPKLNGICSVRSKGEDIRSDRLGFAAQVLEEVGNDVETASDMLSRCTEAPDEKISDIVRSTVCGKYCSQRKCTAVFCAVSDKTADDCFKAAEALAESKGSVTCGELPTGFDGCRAKAQVAYACTHAMELRALQSRKSAFVRRFLEGASEQLSASCGIIMSMAEELDPRFKEDFSLSESAARILADCGIEAKSVSVAFDSDLHPFAEAYICREKKIPEPDMAEMTERLGLLLGYELSKPAIICCGEGDKRIMRIRWRTEASYTPDCRILAFAAESGVSGDSHGCFEDGRGNYYIILADGMGKGARAAAESSMAVNMLRRLILSGAGLESAIRTLNVLMTAASPDETFTTADIMEINLYSGAARLIKMGAAPTVVMLRDGETAYTEVYSDCSAPLGIIASAKITEEHFTLDSRSRLVMTTDGIGPEHMGYITALLENETLTCEQICDKIMAASDENELSSEEKMRRRDDKTVAAVRLYKI